MPKPGTDENHKNKDAVKRALNWGPSQKTRTNTDRVNLIYPAGRPNFPKTEAPKLAKSSDESVTPATLGNSRDSQGVIPPPPWTENGVHASYKSAPHS